MNTNNQSQVLARKGGYSLQYIEFIKSICFKAKNQELNPLVKKDNSLTLTAFVVTRPPGKVNRIGELDGLVQIHDNI